MPKKYKIPSNSEPGVFRYVKEHGTDYLCDCPAITNLCRHIRIVKWWKKEVRGNPEKCFWSEITNNLEEHHLIRGSGNRPYSLTVWLNHDVHRLATRDRDFHNHLIDLFFNQAKPMDKSVKARVVDINHKRLVSNDSSIRLELQSEHHTDAMEFSELDLQEKHYVRVLFGENEIWGSIKKCNYDIVKDITFIRIDCPGGETIKEIELTAWVEENPGEEVVVEYKGKQ